MTTPVLNVATLLFFFSLFGTIRTSVPNSKNGKWCLPPSSRIHHGRADGPLAASHAQTGIDVGERGGRGSRFSFASTSNLIDVMFRSDRWGHVFRNVLDLLLAPAHGDTSVRAMCKGMCRPLSCPTSTTRRPSDLSNRHLPHPTTCGAMRSTGEPGGARPINAPSAFPHLGVRDQFSEKKNTIPYKRKPRTTTVSVLSVSASLAQTCVA